MSKQHPLGGGSSETMLAPSAFHFTRSYSRASTPVSPQLSKALASGKNTNSISNDSSTDNIAAPLARSNAVFSTFFQAHKLNKNNPESPTQTASMAAGESISRPYTNGLPSPIERSFHRSRISPRPRSPNVSPISLSTSSDSLNPALFPAALRQQHQSSPSIALKIPAPTAANPKVEKAPQTEHLIRQIFLPREPHQTDWRDRLPTLSSSDEVNIEIYALFGLICRQFIQTWYYKIVDDPAFIYDISGVLAHVVKQLEERLGTIDMFGFLLDEIPLILDEHIKDVRLVRERYKSVLLPAAPATGVKSLGHAFHSIRPHPALASAADETAFLQVLSKGVTIVLLDQANLNSPLALSLVSTIVCDIGLKNAVEKLSEPWMLYDIFTKIVDVITQKQQQEAVKEQEETAVKKTAPVVTATAAGMVINPSTVTTQVGTVYRRVVRLCGSALARGGKMLAFVGSFASGEASALEKTRVPLIGTSVFSLISTLLNLEERKPLVPAALRVCTVPLSHGRLGKVCNRVVAYYLQRFLGNAGAVANIIRIARETLFPNAGPMGPGRVYPDPDEQAAIRARAHKALLGCMSETAKFMVLGDEPKESIDEILDLFADKTVNKHLVYALLEHIIARLVPELTEVTPQELLDIKLGPATQSR